MRLALFIAATCALAQTPSDVLDVLRKTSQALTERKPDVFLDHFDRTMPGYNELAADVTALTAIGPVSTTIEIARDTGGPERREIHVDWFMRVGAYAPKRATLKFTFERRDGKWIIVALDRPGFFRLAQ